MGMRALIIPALAVLASASPILNARGSNDTEFVYTYSNGLNFTQMNPTLPNVTIFATGKIITPYPVKTKFLLTIVSRRNHCWLGFKLNSNDWLYIWRSWRLSAYRCRSIYAQCLKRCWCPNSQCW